ncbi:MAG TPA: hypothetical protein VNL70_03595 [Tepidisphaeraceae bacterium]|nr:hypothetical protein [Tepidisphaeraceae bacterium]
MTMRQRQDAALRDPFSYGPSINGKTAEGGSNSDWPTVTGGKTGELDKKALKRDLDRVFNP